MEKGDKCEHTGYRIAHFRTVDKDGLGLREVKDAHNGYNGIVEQESHHRDHLSFFPVTN